MSMSNYVIGVMGGKGGVGKSVFTANLALANQKELRVPTLLIDLDQKSCGDQNIILGVKPLKTVSEFINYKGMISSTSLRTMITKHPSSMDYLGAVKSPEQKLSGDSKLFSQQLSSLSQIYKYIYIDMGCEIGELQLSALNHINILLVVITSEILVVNQTRRIINELSSASVPHRYMQLILNKKQNLGVQTSTIEQILKIPLLNSVPFDETTSMRALSSSQPFVLSSPQAPVSKTYHQIIRQLTGGILQRNKQWGKIQTKNPLSTSSPVRGTQEKRSKEFINEKLDPLTLLRMQVHSELIQEMDLKKDLTKSKDKNSLQEIRTKATKIVSQIVDKRGRHLSRTERAKVIKHVLDEALGLGVLEDLLSDPTVTEIMVNGAHTIYCEKNGKIQLSNVAFTSNNHLKVVIERIITPLGRRIDEKTPYVDARLTDGSRVNAIIEPLSIDGPSLTIRKFPQERIEDKDLILKFGSLTEAMGEFLKICVEQGINIVISGGTGSGKTTFLNVLSGFIPGGERIITVEDAAELQLKQRHVVRLETRPKNLEGSGEVTIRDLIINSLRMRPDRIIVGECRDGAALDMLSAMNTGHDGSMTTVHANTPREALSRLETLCLMAGMELPIKAIREQISKAIHLIIQISRLSDGSRKVLSITEIVGMQGDVVTTQEIFRFKEEGFDKNRKVIGQFQAMGRIPTFIEKFEARGVKVPKNLFTTQSSSQVKKKVETRPKPKLYPRMIKPIPNISKKVGS